MDIEKRLAKLEAQIDTANGRIYALKVVLGSVMAVAPFRRDLLEACDAMEDVVLARALPEPVPEVFLDGAREVLSEVRLALERSQEP